MLKRLIAGLCLLTACSCAQATTYYLSNAGSDSNTGTSPANAWQTVQRLNRGLAAAKPGDSFLLKRGDVFRDTPILCGSEYLHLEGQTLSSQPPKCSGTTERPITIGAYGTGENPFVDSADLLRGSWTPLSGGTFQLHLAPGEPLPLKLYLDPTPQAALGQQLLPVPNDVGRCSPDRVYAYLDMWHSPENDQKLGIAAGPTPAHGCSGLPFRIIDAASDTSAVQTFPPGRTGLQNVQAGSDSFAPKLKGFGYPHYQGAWYVNGSKEQGYTVYLHLADGSDPNRHRLSATHRNYGILLEGSTHVTVQDITVAHSFESCILDIPFSDSDPLGSYTTIQRVRVFNCASMQSDFVTAQQSHASALLSHGGIVFHTSGIADPPNLIGPAVLNSYVGTLDTYFGTENRSAAGILFNGVDGGGTANHCLACGNFISTTNSPGIIVTMDLPSHRPLMNQGGRVAHNELTNNQSNIGFASLNGGQLDHNYVHESYGQGIQLGGNSQSVDGGPNGPVPGSQVIEENIIVNLGKSASRSLYNGIDCNSSSVLFSGFYLRQNTVINTWGAGLTFEGKGSGETGCTAPHVWNNVVDQRRDSFGNAAANLAWTPATQQINNSNALYLTNALHKGFDFHNNFYRVSPQQRVLVHTNNPNYDCQSWLANGPDRGSTCDGTDPLFTDVQNHNFHPQPNSPLAKGQGRNQVIGALP